MPPRNPFKTVVVTGVPGVGKTTVLSELKRLAQESGVDLVVANFGDYMLKVAVARGLVESRDEMRRLPHRVQLDLQELAAREIVSDAAKRLGQGGVLVVDTHSVVKTSSGYWPGLPEHVVSALNPDSIVLIEADPEEILARRESDASRRRSDVGSSPEALRELMHMARVAAMSSAVLTASSVFIVVNPQGRPEEAAAKILELVASL
ncbi:MAG: adenylate kinase [Fervidicoccaceae archaeon]